MTGIFLFIFFLIFVSSFSFSNLGTTGGLIVVSIYILGGIVFSISNAYNKIKAEHIKLSEARSNIGVYLQQRYDEIAALYKIVQEFKLHEMDSFREIVRLRQVVMRNENLSFKEKTEIHNQIEQRMPKLLATFENYPELRSNQNFLQLQEAIKDNEANIAASRKTYNSYVNRYNTSISMFPTFLLAKMLNFTLEDLYEAPQDRRVNPLL